MSNKSSVIFISFLLFWLLLAPTSAIIPDPTISGWIKNAICLCLIWYVREDIITMFDKEFRIYNFFLLIYCAISILSILYNADTIGKYAGTYMSQHEVVELEGVTSIKGTLYSSLGLLTATLYIQRISDTEDMRIFLKTFFWLLLLVLLPTDINVFLISTSSDVDAVTLYNIVGNKFSVGYYHLYLCTCYYFLYPFLESQRNRYILFSLILMMLVVSIRTQCSTMVLAALVFMFLSLFAPYISRFYISSAKSIITALLIFGIGFFLFSTWLLQFEISQHLLNLLDEDITLTGRIQIFSSIQQAFTLSPWIGLGYGNSSVVSHYFTGALNSQNGLVDLFIQLGFLGVSTFIAMLFFVSKRIEKDIELRYPLVVFIYTAIVISMAEVPFKFIFIFFLSFCFIEEEAYGEVFEYDDIDTGSNEFAKDEVLLNQTPELV